MDIGKSLKEIRIKSLMSQTDFAEVLGVSFSTVNRWENNKTIPNYQTLNKIKKYCEEQGLPFNVEILEEDR